MTPIVMLVGRARSGKNTAADVICRELRGVDIGLADPMKRFLADPEGYGLTREQLWGSAKETPFAHRDTNPAALSELAQLHFGIAEDELVELFEDELWKWARALPETTTPRHMLQSLGTECVRNKIDHDFWIDYGLDVARSLLLGDCWYEREKGVVESDRAADVVVVTDGMFRNEALPVLEMGGTLLRTERPDDLKLAGSHHASETQQLSMPDWWFSHKFINDKSLLEFTLDVTSWCKAYGRPSVVPSMPR